MGRGENGHILRKKKTPGLAPGTLVHVGKRHLGEPIIQVTTYSATHIDEHVVKNAKEAKEALHGKHVTWINVIGLHDIALIQDFEKPFGLHPLLLEDVVNTEQRPKVEEYEDHTFIVLKSLEHDKGHLHIEHISIVIGDGYVITFQERPGDVFIPIHERIRSKRRIITKGPDYLAYALMDSIVDYYYTVFESIADHIGNIENEVVKHPLPGTMQHVLQLKREMMALQKSTWPVRELIATLIRGESKFVKKDTMVYLRDVYDHAVQIMETSQTYRDMIGTLMDLYMSAMSNRMNEVMKVLTIIATIFIPLTFITGIYGMNFTHMPEIPWKYGYTFALGLMAVMAVLMLWFFRRKKWL